MSRPIRFGVAAHAVDGADTWRNLAVKVEGQGYATLLLPDHTNPQFAPIPALVAAAAVTATTEPTAMQFRRRAFRGPFLLRPLEPGRKRRWWAGPCARHGPVFALTSGLTGRNPVHPAKECQA